MRVLFCGTPEFAVPALQHLLAQGDFSVVGVITQPDRPRGRGMELSPSPVKQIATAAGVQVLQPERIRVPETEESLRRLEPDVVVIIAYGQIIPARLLAIPQYGWINLHGSLLPKYRGAAPVQWAIAGGDAVTGLTTMRIDAGMDTGDILLQQEIPIGAKETAAELAARMAEAGAPLMADTLRGLIRGAIQPQPQNHERASYAPMLKKEDGRIDWTRSAGEVYNRMRAFTPWPGAFTTFRSQTVHLWAEPLSSREPASSPAIPGSLRLNTQGLWVACGGATELRVLSVKRQGGKSIDAVEYARGVRLTEGERFGDSELR